MTSEQAVLLRDILSDLAQDDIGLWEVGWRANVLFERLPEPERSAIAEAVIEHLLAGGLAKIVDSSGNVSSQSLPAPGALREIWNKVPPDTRLWLRATEAGETMSQLPP